MRMRESCVEGVRKRERMSYRKRARKMKERIEKCTNKEPRGEKMSERE